METSVEVYIDIISPYCYLAFTQLPELARRYSSGLNFHPVHIATAKIAAGNYGPSNMEVPDKAKVLLRDMQRWADRYQVPLKFPRSFQGEPWNIGVLFASKFQRGEIYLRESYTRLWAEGGDPADMDLLHETAQQSGLDAGAFMSYVKSSKGHSEFRHSCIKAHRLGIFGAPIMIFAGEVFWGNDRLDFLEELLKKQKSEYCQDNYAK